MDDAGKPPERHERILEVQGWFPNSDALVATIEGLRQAGYVHADASLPAGWDAPDPGKDAGGPTPVDRQLMRTLTASLGATVGALAAGVAVLATGMAIPIAVGAAVAGGIGSGAAIERASFAAHERETDQRDRQGAEGTLLLAMHVNDQVQVNEVIRIMGENGVTKTRLITDPKEALTTGISAASWTG